MYLQDFLYHRSTTEWYVFSTETIIHFISNIQFLRHAQINLQNKSVIHSNPTTFFIIVYLLSGIIHKTQSHHKFESKEKNGENIQACVGKHELEWKMYASWCQCPMRVRVREKKTRGIKKWHDNELSVGRPNSSTHYAHDELIVFVVDLRWWDVWSEERTECIEWSVWNAFEIQRQQPTNVFIRQFIILLFLVCVWKNILIFTVSIYVLLILSIVNVVSIKETKNIYI